MMKVSQEKVILNKLERADGGWVSLPDLVFYDGHCFIASHTKIISNLRDKGHIITCRKEVVEGQHHVWYKLG